MKTCLNLNTENKYKVTFLTANKNKKKTLVLSILFTLISVLKVQARYPGHTSKLSVS